MNSSRLGGYLHPMTNSGGWGCPHDENGKCLKRDKTCDPGSEGCVLEGRVASPPAAKKGGGG